MNSNVLPCMINTNLLKSPVDVGCQENLRRKLTVFALVKRKNNQGSKVHNETPALMPNSLLGPSAHFEA